jgi:hypothetical protein
MAGLPALAQRAPVVGGDDEQRAPGEAGRLQPLVERA